MIDQRERELEDEIAKLKSENEGLKGVARQVMDRTELVKQQYNELMRQRDEALSTNQDYALMEWLTDFRKRATKEDLMGTRWRRLTTQLKRLWGDPPGGAREILRDFKDWETGMLLKDAQKLAKLAKKAAKV